MAKKKTNEDPVLDVKSAEIRDPHVKCEEFKTRSGEAAREAVLRAWRAGRLLLEIKSKFKNTLEMAEWIKHQWDRPVVWPGVPFKARGVAGEL